jgi:hypothetical protein
VNTPNVNDARVAVDVASFERDPLLRPQSGRRGELNDRPELRPQFRGDRVDLGERERPHAARRRRRVRPGQLRRVLVEVAPADRRFERLPERAHDRVAAPFGQFGAPRGDLGGHPLKVA